MKKILAGIAVVTVFGWAFAVGAADTAGVSATVTVQNISVTVSDGTLAYGTLGLNTSKDTTSGGLNDTQVATNNGNVTENFNIRGQNSVAWTLEAATDANKYKHEFCKAGAGAPDPCDATPVYTALTTSNQTLASSVAADGTQRFDLKITTPTSSSSFTPQSVDVTVQVVAS